MNTMNHVTKTTALGIAFLLISSCSPGDKNNPTPEKLQFNPKGRTEISFVNGWKFHRGDLPGAENPGFTDGSWRLLDLPHDWSIEDKPGTESPFDSAAVGGIDAGYTVGGTGWYRKSFQVPRNIGNKKVKVLFDGIYMNSDVWLNGKHLGNHPYGYTAFFYDLTESLLPGKKNILAVRVKNEGHNSRWYSGSGIYRNVKLLVTEPVSVDLWGQFITTPEVKKDLAKVQVKSKIVNSSGKEVSLLVHTFLRDKDGKIVAEKISETATLAGEPLEIQQEFDIENPDLWSTNTPCLYTSVTEVYLTGNGTSQVLTDKTETHFGIRTFTLSAKEGFLLNGIPLELKGGCMHHDNGPLGASAFKRAEERRVELMKASGYNAIRCAHNPPSEAFLDACDRLGILVMDEAFDMWMEPKNPDDYHLYFNEWWEKDLSSMIVRDRNHPSVIFWSIGNEIPERAKPEGAELATKLTGFVRSLDPTRPVTSAVNSLNPDKDPYFASLDVCGYNYALDNYVSDIRRLPERIIIATESFPLEAFDYWMGVIDHPAVIGDFVWTGFDYLGEASIGWLGYPHEGSFYPWNHAFCGDLDICGYKRPQSYYRDVLWLDKPAVSIFVKQPVPSFEKNPKTEWWSKWNWQDVVSHWNWEKFSDKNLEVEVYSSCEEVELFLNGQSLGKKQTNRATRQMAVWNTPWEPGTLKAIGYFGSAAIANAELKTAGKVTRIRMIPDRKILCADGQDLSFITVELVDSSGTVNPDAEDLVRFEISGPGTLAAVGSSNPMSTESFQQPGRKAWKGRCMVIVRAGHSAGEITVKARVNELSAEEIILVSQNQN